uniref:Uncharacterized protein n=1 Tax=Arundo donax TaxID=35708 RepID=A0A0A9ARW4_ARUDO
MNCGKDGRMNFVGRSLPSTPPCHLGTCRVARRGSFFPF